MKIKIGKKSYKGGKNDYAGMIGTIEWCGKCCKANRIQFDEVGNNVSLSDFDILKCTILPDKSPK